MPPDDSAPVRVAQEADPAPHTAQNLILHVPPNGAGGEDIVLKLADFGSSVDRYAVKHLYDPPGPSPLDETLEYAPPEVCCSTTRLTTSDTVCPPNDILFCDGVPCSAVLPLV